MKYAALATAPLTASKTEQPTGLGWALWSVAAALPWLVPTHSEPWTTFYSELLMAVLLIPIAAWSLVVARAGWRADLLVVALTVTAAVPLAQALGGMFAFSGEALLISLYMIGIALTMASARHAEEVAPRRLADALFASLGIAALLSCGIAIYQWLELDVLGLMVAVAGPGGRPVANVGQANNLCTLLVWGLIAIGWGYSRKHLHGLVATLAATYLLVGVALTQSRTGIVAVVAVMSVVLLSRRRLNPSPSAQVLVGLAAWFTVLVLGFESLNQLMLRTAPLSLSDQGAAGKRPMIWMMTLEAIAQRPWLGYGWNQSVQAHVALSERFPELHTTIQFAHNVVLDLLMWNGLPLGLLLVVGLGLWFWAQLRGPQTQERLLLLLALGVFLLHALLELPHAIAFFLLPVAAMMGMLSATRPLPTVLTVPRVVPGAMALVLAALLVLIFVDYRRIEDDRMAWRMRVARIGGLAEKPAPDIAVLGALQSALLAFRVETRRDMSADDLEQLRRAAFRFPAGLTRYARAIALNGQPDEARRALAAYCRLRSSDDCLAAGDTWRALIAEGNPEMERVVLPLGMTPTGGN